MSSTSIPRLLLTPASATVSEEVAELAVIVKVSVLQVRPELVRPSTPIWWVVAPFHWTRKLVVVGAEALAGAE